MEESNSAIANRGGNASSHDESGDRARSDRNDKNVANGSGGIVQEKVSQVQEAVADKASEFSEKAHDTAEAGINKAAGGIEQAADQLREKAEQSGIIPEKVGVRVADGLDKTSGYLRDHESQEIWADVEKFVKEHPMQAAVTAAFAGYFFAKMMK